MTEHQDVYGVFHLKEHKWIFFRDEQEAIDFVSDDENIVGPHRFPFDAALNQLSKDHLVVSCVPQVLEEEFIEILNDEDLDPLFFLSEELDNRIEPSEGYFEDTDEALYWLRSCCIYILQELERYAVERDGVLEDFDYYDGFLSRLETLIGDYLGDIEDFERVLYGLYDGFGDETNTEEYG